MTEGDLGPGEQQPPEPSWDEKVLALNAALGQHQLPYAFGGAIALNYHREPRSTLDIDINVFVDPVHEEGLLDVLADVYDPADRQRLATELRQAGQARSLWGATYVDLFLANTELHNSMAARIERQPFGDTEIPVLSIEDLIICKALFDRPKDWLDIDAVAATHPGKIDAAYVTSWVEQFLEPDDPRLARLQVALG